MGLPRTIGYIEQATDVSHSGTSYKLPSNLIGELYYQESTGVIGGERLGTQNTVWIPYNALATKTLIARSDKLIIDINGLQSLTVSTIAWQSDNIIRYTFTGSQDLHLLTINTWYQFTGSKESVNDGIFDVVNIGSNYIDITNPLRSDATKNETSSTSILTHIFPEFEIEDIKREIQSMFEDHYELSIFQKTN